VAARNIDIVLGGPIQSTNRAPEPESEAGIGQPKLSERGGHRLPSESRRPHLPVGLRLAARALRPGAREHGPAGPAPRLERHREQRAVRVHHPHLPRPPLRPPQRLGPCPGAGRRPTSADRDEEPASTADVLHRSAPARSSSLSEMQEGPSAAAAKCPLRKIAGLNRPRDLQCDRRS
jgi:hypothetical protein